MSNETQTKSFNVDFFAYHFENREGKKAISSRIGIASRSKDGKSINIKLNAFPVNGRLTLVVPDQHEEVDNSGQEE
jgi:hypothetical protein